MDESRSRESKSFRLLDWILVSNDEAKAAPGIEKKIEPPPLKALLDARVVMDAIPGVGSDANPSLEGAFNTSPELTFASAEI
jgi:hypothetical protein